MASRLELQENLWRLYMCMDPDELDNTLLEYEMELRRFNTREKGKRTRARLITQAMHDESDGGHPVDHLFRSPFPADQDLALCDRLARHLDAESNKRRISFQALDSLWSKAAHLTARLARIAANDGATKRQKFELLYWAENIRERIERQRWPQEEFVPVIEIETQYQHIPATIEDIAEDEDGNQAAGNEPNVAPEESAQSIIQSDTEATRDDRQMDDIIRRLNDVAPIELASSNFSTPISMPSATRLPPISTGSIETPISEGPNWVNADENSVHRSVPRVSPSTTPEPREAASFVDTPQSILDIVARNQRWLNARRLVTPIIPISQPVLIQLDGHIPTSVTEPPAVPNVAMPVSRATGARPKTSEYDRAEIATHADTVAPTQSTYTITKTTPIIAAAEVNMHRPRKADRRRYKPQFLPNSTPVSRAENREIVPPISTTSATAPNVGKNPVYSQAVIDAIERRRQQREIVAQVAANARRSLPVIRESRLNPISPRVKTNSAATACGIPTSKASNVPPIAREQCAPEVEIEIQSDEITRLKAMCQRMSAEMEQQRVQQMEASRTISDMSSLAGLNYRGDTRNATSGLAGMFTIPNASNAAERTSRPHESGREDTRNPDSNQRNQSGSERNWEIERSRSRRSNHSDSSRNYPRSEDSRENNNRRNANRARRDPSPSDSPSDSDNGDRRRENCPGRRIANRAFEGRSRNAHRAYVSLKTPPINHWKVCFSGDPTPVNKYDVNIHKFIALVSCYCAKARIPEEAILEQIMHLLAGSALDWYQNECKSIHTWADFVSRLKAFFLPLSYDFELIAQANRRKQGKKACIVSVAAKKA